MGVAGIIPAAASASTHNSHRSGRSHDVTATTRLRDRPDSGNGGNWALDRFTRVATITPAGTGTLANCGITTAPSFTVTLIGNGLSAPDGNGWGTTIVGNHAVLSDGSVALVPGTDYTDGAWSGTGATATPYVSTLTLTSSSAWKAGDTLKVTVPAGDSVKLSAPTAGTVNVGGTAYTVTACNAYTAALKDNGTFTTIPLAYTPNQGPGDTGLKLPARPVNGQMNGYGTFTTFYATAAPDASLVPGHVTGSADPSSTWPELFFPAGTTFGVTEATWGYHYSAQVKTTVCRHHRQCTSQTTVQHQHWADTYSNGAGQLPADGNITG
jgi:hypothetical protein